MLHVVHVSPRVQARGGIETLHAIHRHLPLEQTFVALFDREPEPRSDYVNLGATWRTPLWVMRRRFRRALGRYPGSLVVYHDGWGFPLFHELDGAARRIAFLHTDPIYHARDLPAMVGLIDGAAGVTPALEEAWQRVLPELTPQRTTILRAPIAIPQDLPQRQRTPGEPIVIGYAGRIVRANKRLDRLPGLLRALRAAGVNYRFELLGDGALRPALERQLGGEVIFHGWKSQGDYWRVLAGWDALVFFSEHEGGPIAMFEAMGLGVVPFFPAMGGSWGDVYVPQLCAHCYYPPGDLGQLARSIRDVFQFSPADIANLRSRVRATMAEHRVDRYAEDCLALFRAVAEQPRISSPGRRRPRLADLLPLGYVARFSPGALLH